MVLKYIPIYAALAALFLVAPALAEHVPVVGHVFARFACIEDITMSLVDATAEDDNEVITSMVNANIESGDCVFSSTVQMLPVYGALAGPFTDKEGDAFYVLAVPGPKGNLMATFGWPGFNYKQATEPEPKKISI